MKFETTIGEQDYELNLDVEASQVSLNGEAKNYEFIQQDNGRYLLRMGTKLYKLDSVNFDKHTVEFQLNGEWCSVDVRDEQDLLLDRLGFKSALEMGEGEVNAPMPGKILDIMASEGDEVEEGQAVAILEAMKMENELKAPVHGIVTTIHASVGDSVEKNAKILEIEASG